MKIGFLIPATSNNREWKTFDEVYLYKYVLRSFVITSLRQPINNTFKFYIGIDKGDPIYDNKDIQNKLKMFINRLKNTDLEFIYMDDIDKGHVTKMWNCIFKIAYDDNCDYFFQCGDDIYFKSTGWINDCIDTLQKNNNIGLTGPINNHPTLLTQSFVSRKHMDIFGFYFPEEIRNWFCDDWINGIYIKAGKFCPLKNHTCINAGGDPRYIINDDENFKDNYNKNILEGKQNCEKIVNKYFDKYLVKI
jgi:hypothetical protein